MKNQPGRGNIIQDEEIFQYEKIFQDDTNLRTRGRTLQCQFKPSRWATIGAIGRDSEMWGWWGALDRHGQLAGYRVE